MNNFGNRPVALFFWQDVDKCIAIMKELENVEMTANLLLKNSDIVTTIRRVSNSGFIFADILITDNMLHFQVYY